MCLPINKKNKKNRTYCSRKLYRQKKINVQQFNYFFMQNMPLIINLNLFSCKIQDLIYSLDQLKVMCGQIL